MTQQRRNVPSDPAMHGVDFVAVVGLSDKAGAVLAAPGQTCERVPAVSLGWLLEQGLIAPKGAA